MIQITRNLARQIRSVFRRALNVTPRGPSYPIILQAGPGGLCIRAQSPVAAVEYHGTGSFSAEQITLPFEFLADCEGKKDEPVQLEAGGDGRIAVQWRDGDVPQIVQYGTPEAVDFTEFPRMPENPATNPIRFLAAMKEAAETTDPNPTRFATNHVQLRGSGSIAATDSCQLLVQSGFQFPWDGEVLVPANKVFACPDLAGLWAVAIGKSAKWLSLGIGPWTLHLPLGIDLRFPNLQRHIPRAADAAANCRLSPADARFLAATLPRLPRNDLTNDAITLDLNGSVAVRAKGAAQEKPTEVILTNSSWSGQPIRIQANRQYLARAVHLGFAELHLYTPASPALWQDGNRQYVWALLDPETAIGPTTDPVRIESPADPAGAVPNQRRRRKDVSKPNNNPKPDNEPETTGRNGQSHAAAAVKPEQPSGAIAQAVSLRDTLRDATNKANELIRVLQHDKKQGRQLRTALASLREIQQLEI
jgi:hypothetical protein